MKTKHKGWKEQSGGAWKDLKTGLVWLPAEPGSISYNDAIEKYGDAIPTTNEFIEAEKHGVRKVFDDFRGWWFWARPASSSLPADRAYVFDGDYGYIYYYDYYRDDRYVNDTVRCVLRPGVKSGDSIIKRAKASGPVKKRKPTVRERAEKLVTQNVSWGSQDDGVLELETIKTYLAGYRAAQRDERAAFKELMNSLKKGNKK